MSFLEIIDHGNPALAAEIHRIYQAAYQVEANLLEISNFPPLKRSVSYIMDSSTTFWGQWKSKGLVALAEIDLGNVPHIDGFVVDPHFFRRGIGGLFLKKLLEQLNCPQVSVSTAQGNIPAIQLYQKHGFQQVRQWQTPDHVPMVDLFWNSPTLAQI